MSVDIIARSLARAATPVAATATAIPTLQLAMSVGVIQTSGYAVSGTGAGLYVSDALATLALATVHPRFCKQSLDGRYWRLIGDEVTAEQGGALGTAGTTNDQPAIQAALDYANAVGIRRVRLTQAYYQLRAPLRANGLGGYDPAGNYLVTTENVALVGVPGRTMLKCYNSNGGTNDTITQTVDGSPWIGPLFYVKPNTTMDWVSLENVEFDGTVTYTPGVTVVNLSSKGFRIQDTMVNKVELRNVT